MKKAKEKYGSEGIRRILSTKIDGVRDLIINAFCDGYEKGCKDTADQNAPLVKMVDESYQKGLDDAWRIMQKIHYMSDSERHDIFDVYTLGGVIDLYLFNEAKEKIEAWEEKQEKKQEYKCNICIHKVPYGCDYTEYCNDDNSGFEPIGEIKVGDEVLFENAVKAVVTALDPDEYGFYDILFANGETSYVSQDDVTKTGRHFDIDKILEQIRRKE